MNTPKVAISVLLTIGLLSLANAEDSRFTEETDELAALKKTVIVDEISSLSEPLWAGEYYAGDGLGKNVSLYLSPDAGFLFEWRGCLGLYDRNFGKVIVNGTDIHLEPEFDNQQEGFRGIAERFRWIKWEERDYLIASTEYFEFCNEINSGSEPRNLAHGSVLIRRGDWSKEIEGPLQIPTDFPNCLLKEPIIAQLADLTEATLQKSNNDFSFWVQNGVIDAGSDDGVFEGMKLYLILNQRFEIAKVIGVDKQSSTVLFSYFEDEGENPEPVKVGWTLCTKMTEEDCGYPANRDDCT